MARFGWMQLAYLVATLVMLALLVKLGPLVASTVSPGGNVQEGPLSYLAREETIPPESTVQEDENPETTTPAVTEDTSGDEPEETIFEETPPEETPPEGVASGDHEHTATSGLYENVDFESEAPVFYRPVEKMERATASRKTLPASGRSSDRPSGGRACKNVSAAPAGAEIVFPLTREYFDSYEDTWGAARPQGGHEGTDLMAPDGTPLLAMTDATVVPVSGANQNGWNDLGGYTVMLQADYSIGPVKKGDLFYYAHMSRPTGLGIGEKVEVGDVVGYVGDTGEGPQVTRGLFPPHLHLGWYDVGGGRSQVASGAMNPYPLLEWVEANGGSIEGGSDIPYCEAPQPATPTPSGGGNWQYPTNPGVRPDMDTGTRNAAPTPAMRPVPSAESSPNVTPNEVPDKPKGNAPSKGKTDKTGKAGNAQAKDRPGRLPDDGKPGDNAANGGSSEGAVSGGAATVRPDPDTPEGGPQDGRRDGDVTNNDSTNAGPFRGFWKLTGEEKVHRLLRLEDRGVDISRFERWLERALGGEETTSEPSSPPDNAGDGGSTGPVEDPESTTPDTGKPDEKATDVDCDLRETTSDSKACEEDEANEDEAFEDDAGDGNVPEGEARNGPEDRAGPDEESGETTEETTSIAAPGLDRGEDTTGETGAEAEAPDEISVKESDDTTVDGAEPQPPASDAGGGVTPESTTGG